MASPAVRVRVERRGGARLEKFAADAAAARGVREIAVGFFASARYGYDPEKGHHGEPVAEVAAKNEYGSPAEKIPERPFFRRALAKAEGDLPRVLASAVDRDVMAMGLAGADVVGLWVAGRIQREIRDLREPPNAPYTIEKKGSDNPLIDTGTMRTSVTWRVVG